MQSDFYVALSSQFTSAVKSWTANTCMDKVTDTTSNMMPGFYARKWLLLSARLGHCNSVSQSVCLSVCPSITRVDQSKTVHARITKSSPSGAWKTLVSGTVKLFHKFEGGHSERGR